MDTLELLKTARGKIADSAAWGKGSRVYDRPKETCCAAEAIEEADPTAESRLPAFRAFRNAAGIEKYSVTEWNDAPDRTHAEVLAVFDLAIATVRL